MTGKEPDESGDGSSAEDRLEPQSMHPLDPEEALRGFMEVDPTKVKERLDEGDEDDDRN